MRERGVGLRQPGEPHTTPSALAGRFPIPHPPPVRLLQDKAVGADIRSLEQFALQLRANGNGISNLLKQPIPFPMYHTLMLMLNINLMVTSYAPSPSAHPASWHLRSSHLPPAQSHLDRGLGLSAST